MELINNARVPEFSGLYGSPASIQQVTAAVAETTLLSLLSILPSVRAVIAVERDKA